MGVPGRLAPRVAESLRQPCKERLLRPQKPLCWHADAPRDDSPKHPVIRGA
jgi:hypothetical protein